MIEIPISYPIANMALHVIELAAIITLLIMRGLDNDDYPR